MQSAPGIIDIAHSIQLAVAPVFLLSGVGVTLTLFTNRLARIVDRARQLEEALPGPPAETPASLRDELAVLSRRARLILRAITLSTSCALLICLVIVTLFGGQALGRDVSGIIVALFITALCAYIGAFVLFLLEVQAATSTMRFGPRVCE